jgi:mannose-6-phosphate isomerase-like protein (cupin superfamily)
MSQHQHILNAVKLANTSTGRQIALGGTLHTFKFASADTAGQFALMEAIVLPHTLVIPHFHTNEDELTIVMEGEAGMRVGDEEFRVSPGDYIFVPRGTPHAVWNPTDTPGKAITIFTPAGLEGFFEAMGAVFQASSPPDFAKLGAISKQYGVVTVMDWVPELCAKYSVTLG